MFQSDTNFIKFPHILSMLFIPTLHYDMLISVMCIYIYMYQLDTADSKRHPCSSTTRRSCENSSNRERRNRHRPIMANLLPVSAGGSVCRGQEKECRLTVVHDSGFDHWNFAIFDRNLGSWDSWFISIGTWGLATKIHVSHWIVGFWWHKIGLNEGLELWLWPKETLGNWVVLATLQFTGQLCLAFGVIFVGFLEMSLGIRVSPGWRMRIDPQVRKESQNPCQIFQLSLDSICFSILSSILPTVADQRSNVLAEQRLFSRSSHGCRWFGLFSRKTRNAESI